jgi:hypothetical protein
MSAVKLLLELVADLEQLVPLRSCMQIDVFVLLQSHSEVLHLNLVLLQISLSCLRVRALVKLDCDLPNVAVFLGELLIFSLELRGVEGELRLVLPELLQGRRVGLARPLDEQLLLSALPILLLDLYVQPLDLHREKRDLILVAPQIAYSLLVTREDSLQLRLHLIHLLLQA